MRTFMKIIFLFLLSLILAPAGLRAQEVLLPLQNNPLKSKEALQRHATATKSNTSPLTLPFWDDFSYKGPYPDSNLWADNTVFINTSFAVHPKTNGVATFDILNAHGKIYDHASTNNLAFEADQLTSNVIRLDSLFDPAPRALSPADSVLLTFYYQPQGKGGDPAAQDSLVLQFYHPGYYDDDAGQEVEAHWQTVWHAEGESLQKFSKDTFPYFRRVAVAITDSAYFNSQFRFRFKNHASFPSQKSVRNYSGTRSIWNIDYIMLDHGRSKLDSTHYDIAFAAPAQSMLKDHTAMPWSHYIANPAGSLRNNFQVQISNLDNRSYNYSYNYRILDEGERVLRTYSGGSWVINPFLDDGYQDYQPHTRPMLIGNPLPTGPAEERRFSLVHAIREGTTGDKRPRNDTIVFDQHFSNYFAYDKGNPDLIHLTTGYDPARACQFVANHTDTLEAIQIYLMNTIHGPDQQAFYLTVWNSLDPEEIIYQSENPAFTKPEAGDRFLTYFLDEEILVQDTFYIGLQQRGSIDLKSSIGIGFDRENQAKSRLFINNGDADGWMQSVEDGAIMIRPVVKREHITGITTPEDQEETLLTVYPNPARGSRLEINIKDSHLTGPDKVLRVYDAQGRLVDSGQYVPSLNISGYSNGMYILQVMDKNGSHSMTTRFIISR